MGRGAEVEAEHLDVPGHAVVIAALVLSARGDVVRRTHHRLGGRHQLVGGLVLLGEVPVEQHLELRLVLGQLLEFGVAALPRLLQGPEQRAHDGCVEDQPGQDEDGASPPAVLADQVVDEGREDERAQAGARHRDTSGQRAVLLEVARHRYDGRQVDEAEAETCGWVNLRQGFA